jgi:hypothetical protein
MIAFENVRTFFHRRGRYGSVTEAGLFELRQHCDLVCGHVLFESGKENEDVLSVNITIESFLWNTKCDVRY